MEQQKLNPVLVYILAIIGLLCCCFAGLGFVLAGVAFIMAHLQIKKAIEDPESYDVASVKAMKTAKTVALVILIINIIYLCMSIYQIQALGGWDAYMEQVNTIMEEYQNAQQ